MWVSSWWLSLPQHFHRRSSYSDLHKQCILVLSLRTLCFLSVSTWTCGFLSSLCLIEIIVGRWTWLFKCFFRLQALGLIETKDRTTTQITDDINLYKTHASDIKGFYFANAHEIDDLIDVSAANCAGYFTVFATGEPLFDKAAVSKAGAPDVWVRQG